jgi:ABC-type multidrug transport system fused ATPase/permease subunit
VLRRSRLEVGAGETSRSCGPTGSGKSTLLNLLTRFGDPTAGAVRICDVDTRAARLADLRRAVAIVTQRPVLFSLPLRDNLRAGDPDAAWEDVLDACRAAVSTRSSTTCRTATTR